MASIEPYHLPCNGCKPYICFAATLPPLTIGPMGLERMTVPALLAQYRPDLSDPPNESITPTHTTLNPIGIYAQLGLYQTRD